MAIRLNFDRSKPFTPEEFLKLNSATGLYFISTTRLGIRYPFNESRLLYIGMSERRTNSIAARLQDHYEGRSGNVGLTNYRKAFPLEFCHLNFAVLESIWRRSIEDLESYFLLDFVEKFGVYPICNNKTGSLDADGKGERVIDVDWEHFR